MQKKMVLILLKTIALISCSLFCSVNAYSEQLLASFDFESSDSLKEWTQVKNGGEIERVQNPENNGWCIKIDRKNKNAFVRISQKFIFKKPESLRIEAIIKANNIIAGKGESFHTGQLQAMIKENGQEVSHPSAKFTGTFDFQKKIVYADVGENQELVVRVGLQNAKGTMWVDDILIYREE
jgi:hypothetical protein